MSKEEGLLEKVADAPAEILEETMEVGGKLIHSLPGKESLKRVKNYWHALGPGLTTGSSGDDPAGVATYSQTGAKYGFQLLWLAAFTFPLMAVVQEMCARIGLVTGRGLAANIRTHFPRWVLYLTTTLLFAANAFNIGADLGAMAKGAQLLLPDLNFSLLVAAFAMISLGLQIFTSYTTYAKYLKWLALVLLAYIFSALMANLDWKEVVNHAFIPSLHLNREQIILICSILGATISPYLFFWQTSQEVEEGTLKGVDTTIQLRNVSKKEVKSMRVDVWSGMFFSNVVMFFIIAACAAVLFSNGVTNITSAAQAAEALRPFAGNATYFLFAIGLIGTGMLAIPVLAGSASYALSETFGWKTGLNKTLKQAHSFYGIIIISMIIGILMNFIGLDPIKALIYSGIANAIVAPIVLILIVLLSKNRAIMGSSANHRFTTFFGWLITILMVISGIAAIISLIG